jgi:hypothetical protein
LAGEEEPDTGSIILLNVQANQDLLPPGQRDFSMRLPCFFEFSLDKEERKV